MQPRLEYIINVDTGHVTSVPTPENYNADYEGQDNDWSEFVRALRLLGINGEIPYLMAWDGDSEEPAQWTPQETHQYVWLDGTDDGADLVYVDNHLIGIHYNSRGFAQLHEIQTGRIWCNNAFLSDANSPWIEE